MPTSIPFTHVSLVECRQMPKKILKRKRTRNGNKCVPLGETVECGKCGKLFFSTSVINKHPLRDPLTLLYSRSRQLFCDHCDHIQHWSQRCLADGTFLPEITCPPAYYTSQSRIKAFLSLYPEAAGVLHAERP